MQRLLSLRRVPGLPAHHYGDLSADSTLAELQVADGAALSAALLSTVPVGVSRRARPFIVALLEAAAAGGTPSTQALLDLLCSHRLADLDVRARAALILGCHHVGTAWRSPAAAPLHPQFAHAIACVLLRTSGAALSRLKDAINVGGGSVDLHTLVFRDVSALSLRMTILQHFAAEAARMHATDAPPPLRIVVTDLDDTVAAGWLDERWPAGAAYPGAAAFLTELMHNDGATTRLKCCSQFNSTRPPFAPDVAPGWWESLWGPAKDPLIRGDEPSAASSTSGSDAATAGSVSSRDAVVGAHDTLDAHRPEVSPAASSNHAHAAASLIIHVDDSDELGYDGGADADGVGDAVDATTGAQLPFDALSRRGKGDEWLSVLDSAQEGQVERPDETVVVSSARSWFSTPQGDGVTLAASRNMRSRLAAVWSRSRAWTSGVRQWRAQIAARRVAARRADSTSRRTQQVEFDARSPLQLPRLPAAARQRTPAEPASTATVPTSLVVVTARPQGYRGAARRRTAAVMAAAFAGAATRVDVDTAASVPPPPPHVVVLLGTLLRSTSTASIVSRKCENVACVRALWPEATLVWLGDSGQGDAAVASLSMSLDRAGGATMASFIHDVTPTAPRTGDGGVKAAYADREGVVFFDTYPGAASAAVARGLLTHAAAVRVARAAVAGAVEAAARTTAAAPPLAFVRYLEVMRSDIARLIIDAPPSRCDLDMLRVVIGGAVAAETSSSVVVDTEARAALGGALATLDETLTRLRDRNGKRPGIMDATTAPHNNEVQ